MKVKLSVEFHFSTMYTDPEKCANEVGAALTTMTYSNSEAKSHFLVTSFGFFTAVYKESEDRWMVIQHNEVQTKFDWTA